ncbi:HSP20-like chaperone,CS domain,Tudor domain [Cinara cedri]|uniref:RNA helicase n=1 Tax=Cinara cedri TaxID=506608 RepID=A0A5E4N9A1_9HEMI|nr:HSP20-like chaperone,CS domain,Tudor domain [Cinara cedri]
MFNFIKLPFTEKKEKIVRPFLCDQIKQFGFCEGPCLERHTLCKILDKECLNIPHYCFISIQLTKVLSAQRFYGRISKYSTMEDPINDKNWINIDDSFDKIKEELKNVGSTPGTKIPHKNPMIGEMVMIETENCELFRAVVLDTFYNWFTFKVKVNLIDYGYVKEIVSNNVFILPNHLKQYCPVTVEIILSSIIPVEGKNWKTTTTNTVCSLLEPVILEGLECICKVELILGITLWIDTMIVKNCIKCSHFTCSLYKKKSPLLLPRELIDHNLASKTNSKLIDKIKYLNKDVHVWKEEKPLVVVRKSDNLISLFSCEGPKVDENDTVKIQWAHLSKNILYDVLVNYIEDPAHILISNLQFNDRVNALQKDIDEAINNKSVEYLTNATVGTICLAMSHADENKYNRSIIKQINNETAEVLYLDYGDFYSLDVKHLLTIPSKLISKLPFQVIECKLSGFNDILDGDILNHFNDNFMEITSSPICLKVLSSFGDAKFTGGNCYEVVLFNKDINVNVKMAEQYNVYVDNNQIKKISKLNYESVYEDDKKELDGEIKLLESLLKMSIEKKEQQIMSNSNNISENNIIVDKKQNIKSKKHVKIENKYCIDCNVTPVIPQCFWHQDNTYVFIKLNILSVKNYNISHTMENITISIETNSVFYCLTVQLYAYIVENSVTCHVDFDGIRIKAEKNLKIKYQWPRIMKCSKRHKYMIYNIEHINEHMNWNLMLRMLNKYKMLALDQPLHSVNNYCSDYNDSDGSDTEQNMIYED